MSGGPNLGQFSPNLDQFSGGSGAKALGFMADPFTALQLGGLQTAKGGSGGKGGGGSNWSPTQYNPAADMAGFNQLLPGVNAGILNNQAQMGNIASAQGGIAQNLKDLGGAGWNQFTQNQLSQFDVLGNQRRQATLDQLSRQGLTGSAAASTLDQQQLQTNAARQALTGQLGQQGLGFQAQTLGGAGSELAGKGGTLGQQNAFGNDALQNMLANPAIGIGATAASNAGAPMRGGKGGKGK